jgi:hypothetical protein
MRNRDSRRIFLEDLDRKVNCSARGLCQLSGERHLVFRAADEKAFLHALREVGYVLPHEQ